MAEVKYYAFKDLSGEGSYEEIAEYRAYGLVECFHEKPEKPSFSGKDMIVMFFKPFTGGFERCWRGFGKVELIEIDEWQHEYLLEIYKNLENDK